MLSLQTLQYQKKKIRSSLFFEEESPSLHFAQNRKKSQKKNNGDLFSFKYIQFIFNNVSLFPRIYCYSPQTPNLVNLL